MGTGNFRGTPRALGKLISWRNPPRVEEGLYQFRRVESQGKTRLHLRVDPDGTGTLVINASSILHLNPTASQIAYYHLNGSDPSEIQSTIQGSFQGTPNDILEEIRLITADLEAFIYADGKPVNTYSGIEIDSPYSHQPSAPYRMDLALTYRCNNDCPHCYNARSRTYPELSTQKWKKIIDRLWQINIPHLIFTGGEPTLRDDLVELITYAEHKGQITGLNTNGRRLSDQTYLEELVNAGLDHVQITVESHNRDIHDQMVNHKGAWDQTIAGLKNALASPLFVMTNTTMLQNNHNSLDETLDFLGQVGVPTIGLNALIYAGRGKDVGTGLSEEELKPLLDLAQNKTLHQDQRLIWYTPTLYCYFNPLDMGLGIKGCTAALYNMCVEPDGGVIPCQSYYQQLGNLLEDPWKSIWEHDLSLYLRERKYTPEECQTCSLLKECGAGCPLAFMDQPRVVKPVIPPAS
jgi:radical SAM protein with 4Fe4S-binding SPASM domain